MRQSEILSILIIALASILSSCSNDSPIENDAKELIVNGNLHEVITYEHLRSIERLTIKGVIKDDDWDILYEMAKTGSLAFLDMTEATIVGDSAYELWKDDEIPAYQFNGSRTLQIVLLPKKLKSIGAYAFCSCSKLASINFPHSLETIGEQSFANCSKLTAIDLPLYIDSIGARAFYETPISGKLNIPLTLRIIGKQAFAKTNISSVIISHDVQVAEDNKLYVIYNNSVFAACKYLREVVVEEGCKSLELGFTNCVSLERVILPSTLKYIGFRSRYTLNHIFEDCTALSEIDLPNGLLHIGRSAFESTSIQSLDIPKSVQTIDAYSFANINFSEIKVHWDVPLNIGEQVFRSSDLSNTVLFVPKGTLSSYQNHIQWNLFAEIKEE